METKNHNHEIAWRFPVAGMSFSQRATLSSICVVGIVATLLWDRNFIFISVLSLFIVVIWLQYFSAHQISEIRMSPSSIMIGRSVYTKKDIKSFWLEYTPAIGVKELSLELNRWYMPYIRIPLLKSNPVAVRAILTKSWPEKEHPISWLDILSRRQGLSKSQK